MNFLLCTKCKYVSMYCLFCIQKEKGGIFSCNSSSYKLLVICSKKVFKSTDCHFKSLDEWHWPPYHDHGQNCDQWPWSGLVETVISRNFYTLKMFFLLSLMIWWMLIEWLQNLLIVKLYSMGEVLNWCSRWKPAWAHIQGWLCNQIPLWTIHPRADQWSASVSIFF